MPAILSLAHALCGFSAMLLCGALTLTLCLVLLQQPRRLRQAVAQRTEALLETQSALHQQLAEQNQRQEVLRLAKEAAEQASHAKGALLLNLSYELQTPLNTLMGYSEMLLEAAIDAPGDREHCGARCRNGTPAVPGMCGHRRPRHLRVTGSVSPRNGCHTSGADAGICHYLRPGADDTPHTFWAAASGTHAGHRDDRHAHKTSQVDAAFPMSSHCPGLAPHGRSDRCLALSETPVSKNVCLSVSSRKNPAMV